jgi:hypothetical protein
MKTTKPSIMGRSYDPGLEVDAFTAAGSNNKSTHQSYPDMKNLFALLTIVVLATFCSCQKHLTDEELQARIEREVKRQLAAEREAQEKELDQRRVELTARRNALLEMKRAATNTLVPGVARVPNRPSIGDRSANPATALSPGAVRRPQPPPGVTLPERGQGGTLPGRPLAGSHVPGPMPASVPATSETLAAPSVTPAGSKSPSFSPLPKRQKARPPVQPQHLPKEQCSSAAHELESSLANWQGYAITQRSVAR